MEEKIKPEEIDATTIKSLLIRECDKEGLDHRDFFVKFSDRGVWRRRGQYEGRWFIHSNGKYSQKQYHFIKIFEKRIESLGILLKVFRHELLHSRGIDHRDMLDDFECERNSGTS